MRKVFFKLNLYNIKAHDIDTVTLSMAKPTAIISNIKNSMIKICAKKIKMMNDTLWYYKLF